MKQNYLLISILTIVAGALIALTAGVLAANQIKTTETFIMSSDASESSATSSSFSLYIGDSLSGVTNPVKSAQVAVSGVYTGNGNVGIQLGSDLQTFTLANASNPTPFEILYDASSTTALISSAGTYDYTLYVNPSGVTIYGLGAKLVESHRYRPPACGGGYQAIGSLESSTFNTGIASGAAYNSLLWTGTIPGGVGRVKLQLATSESSGGPWTYYGSDCNQGTYYEPASGTPMEIGCPAVHNNKRYFRYKTTICSENDCATPGDTTPEVEDVIVNWSP